MPNLQQDPELFRLYLMRHGAIDSPVSGASYGHTDIELSALGRDQAGWLSLTLKDAPLTAVYSSDLSRARDTARIVAAGHSLEVTALADLREIDMGKWEGQSLAELASSQPELTAQLFTSPGSFRYPGGESFAELGERIAKALARIRADHKTGAVAAVTHGGVCRLLLAEALGLSPTNWLRLAQDFGCVNIIDWYEDQPIVRLVNYTSTI